MAGQSPFELYPNNIIVILVIIVLSL
jgi:hypothetical protein